MFFIEKIMMTFKLTWQ